MDGKSSGFGAKGDFACDSGNGHRQSRVAKYTEAVRILSLQTGGSILPVAIITDRQRV
jgi:hypothetical protein